MITWKLNGRTVAPSGIAGEMMKSIKQKAIEAGASRVLAVRCPVHQRTATMRGVNEKSDGKASLRLDVCCAELTAEIQRVFR